MADETLRDIWVQLGKEFRCAVPLRLFDKFEDIRDDIVRLHGEECAVSEYSKGACPAMHLYCVNWTGEEKVGVYRPYATIYQNNMEDFRQFYTLILRHELGHHLVYRKCVEDPGWRESLYRKRFKYEQAKPKLDLFSQLCAALSGEFMGWSYNNPFEVAANEASGVNGAELLERMCKAKRLWYAGWQ
jgi:hypothetical protein